MEIQAALLHTEAMEALKGIYEALLEDEIEQEEAKRGRMRPGGRVELAQLGTDVWMEQFRYAPAILLIIGSMGPEIRFLTGLQGLKWWNSQVCWNYRRGWLPTTVLLRTA